MSEDEVLFVRTSKQRPIKTESGDDVCSGDNSHSPVDVWDDTELVKAYDAALKLLQDEAMKRIQSKSELPSGSETSAKSKKRVKGNKLWKAGDKCRCKYTVDGLYYEADILQVHEKKGTCVVRYIGYDNEEEVQLSTLLASKGEFCRMKQLQQSQQESESDPTEEMDIENNSSGPCMGNTKNNKSKEKSKKKKKTPKNMHNFQIPNNGYSSTNIPPPLSFPPPPPPNVFNHEDDSEVISAMLMSWYLSGYHVGYYQAMKELKK